MPLHRAPWNPRSWSAAAVVVLAASAVAPAQDRPVWMGTGSCASTACHNGRVDPTRPGGSEYNYWATYDPHARAFAVLRDDRSRRIEAKFLGLNDLASARPENDDLCLRCHVHQGFDARDVAARSPGFTREDGAGCESCHGPASRWIVPHAEAGWDSLTPDQKHAGFGLRATKDLRVRAAVCAECHVGTGTTEVNHDLVAAGHPRLTFDYAGQLAKLPKHWRIGDDRARTPGYDAKAWAVGRLVGAQAALDLLASRAERAAPKESTAPWPEFSEYGCFSCHQAIRPATPLPNSLGPDGPGSPLAWGTWTFAAFPQPTDASLLAVRTLMAEPEPDPAQVARAARLAAAALGRQADRINRTPMATETARETLQALLKAPTDPNPESWDAAAQTYLGAVALRTTLAEVDARYRDPRIRAGLVAAYHDLNLPARTARGVFDSPADFDPGRLRRDWTLILDALPPRTVGLTR